MTQERNDQVVVRQGDYNNLGQALDWIRNTLAKSDPQENSETSIALRAATHHYRESLVLNEDQQNSGFTVDPEAEWPSNLTTQHS